MKEGFDNSMHCAIVTSVTTQHYGIISYIPYVILFIIVM